MQTEDPVVCDWNEIKMEVGVDLTYMKAWITDFSMWFFDGSGSWPVGNFPSGKISWIQGGGIHTLS